MTLMDTMALSNETMHILDELCLKCMSTPDQGIEDSCSQLINTELMNYCTQSSRAYIDNSILSCEDGSTITDLDNFEIIQTVVQKYFLTSEYK